MPKSAKKPTNLSLDTKLLEEARSLNINLSEAASQGLKKAVYEKKKAQWQAENAEAISRNNEWVEKNGLPLAKYRMF